MIRWRHVSAIWLIRILAKDFSLAFHIQRPSLKQTVALRQTLENGPMKRIEKWIVHLPKPQSENWNIFRRVRIAQERRMLEMDETRQIYFDRLNEESSISIQRQVRTLPRRLTRFRRYRIVRENDDAVERRPSVVNEKSGKHTFWMHINVNRHGKSQVDRMDQPNQSIPLERRKAAQTMQNGPVKATTPQTTKPNMYMKEIDFSRSETRDRIKFSASHQESRVINIEDSSLSIKLLNEYMSRPISSFSIRSFHDDDEGSDSSSTSNKNKSQTSQRRRWLVRKLTIEEAINDGVVNVDIREERYFRLAVPLMPLLGVDLTPVIDFEVLSVKPTNLSFMSEANPKMVKIRSMRLSLLSRADEVHKAMEPLLVNIGEGNRLKIESPRPTKVSMNQNIREIGNNAIEMVGKMEDIIKPYFAFDAVITWSDSDNQKSNDQDKSAPLIRVKASTTASFTWNQKNIVHPYVLEKISALVLKRALKLALVQILTQIERDFKQWARHENVT